MRLTGSAARLNVFVDDNDTRQHKPLYFEIDVIRYADRDAQPDLDTAR